MKHCAVCVKDFDDSWKNCVKCGAPLGEAPSAPAPASVYAPAAPVPPVQSASEDEKLSRLNADYLRKASRRLKRDFIWYMVLSAAAWVFLIASPFFAKAAPVATVAFVGLSLFCFAASTLLGFFVTFRLAFTRNALGDSAALHLLLAIFVPFGIAVIPIFAILSAGERLRQIEARKADASAAVPRLGIGSKIILAASVLVTLLVILMLILAVALPAFAAARNKALERAQGAAVEERADSGEDRSLESYYAELGIKQ